MLEVSDAAIYKKRKDYDILKKKKKMLRGLQLDLSLRASTRLEADTAQRRRPFPREPGGCLTQARGTKLLTRLQRCLPLGEYHQVTTYRSSDFSAPLSPPLEKVF